MKHLGDVCTIVNGGTPDTAVSEYWGGTHLWITPAEMGKRSSPYAGDTKRKITELGLRNSSATMLPINSVILSSRAPIGHLIINTLPMATNQGCKGLVPAANLQPKFLYYYLQSIVQLLDSMGSGATFKEISTGKLKQIRIPLAPRPEQRRLVGILDQAFAAIATAKANTKENLQNARALKQSAVHLMLSANTPSWTHTKIGKQIVLQRGFDITKVEQKPGSVPVVSSGGIKSYHSSAMAQAPGVVLGRKGTLGKVYYLETDFWPHDTTLWVKQFNGNDPKFVYHFLANLDVSGLDSGAANPALNRNQVHPIEIDWPPISDQKLIAQRLDSIDTQTQSLQSLYRRKLAALDELKKSLLHQAFSGNL